MELITPTKTSDPSVGVLQWIQYQLDNCANVDEVIKTDAVLRIESNGTPLHYLVADADGKTATIEFLHGKMVVHAGNDLPFPVLTKTPITNLLKLKNIFFGIGMKQH
jgi:choloylglycine hydrolase